MDGLNAKPLVFCILIRTMQIRQVDVRFGTFKLSEFSTSRISAHSVAVGIRIPEDEAEPRLPPTVYRRYSLVLTMVVVVVTGGPTVGPHGVLYDVVVVLGVVARRELRRVLLWEASLGSLRPS